MGKVVLIKVNMPDFDFFLHLQLIKQYYNRQTTVSSNRYPVAFLSVNVPPELLDVNLEPNKTSVMLTNKDELMTILTNLVENFYSDEKNKLSSSKDNNCNGSAEKRIALIGKLGDITNTCDSNGEGTTSASSNVGEKIRAKEKSLHLDRNMVLDNNPSLVQHEAEGTTNNKQIKTVSSSSLFQSNCTQEDSMSNKNDLQSEKPSCHEGMSSAHQVKDKLPSSVVVNMETVNQVVSLPSFLHKDTSMLCPTDPSQFVELSETSDKSLCEVSESMCNIEKNVSTCNSSNLKESSSVKENGHLETSTCNSLLNLERDKSNKIPVTRTENTENTSVPANTEGKPEGSKDLSKNRTLPCTPSNRPSLKKIFSLDLDDLFDDSEFDLSGINSNLKTPGTSDNVPNSEKDASGGISSSATVEESVSASKPSETTTKAQCSDKDWSMGCGVVDKQGTPVQVQYKMYNTTPVGSL